MCLRRQVRVWHHAMCVSDIMPGAVLTAWRGHGQGIDVVVMHPSPVDSAFYANTHKISSIQVPFPFP